MLIKASDNRDSEISELKQLLERQITAKQRFLIEREIKCLGSGVKGEESSAYYIDFHYKNSPRWVVIHDLRLRYEDFVAQIDHLLINRFLEIYVLESKNFYYGIKITPEGEFLVWNGKTYVGIESPIEQNRRHVHLLEKVIARAEILPARLGIPISASFHDYVLIAPNTRVDRPSRSLYDSSKVIKADALVTAIDKRVDSMGVSETFAAGVKVISFETLEIFARELVKRHRPAKFDYAKKFGIPETDDQPVQKLSPVSSEPPSNVTKKGPTCDKCGTNVDSKVVFFCRMNKKKFEEKLLCRSCQASY